MAGFSTRSLDASSKPSAAASFLLELLHPCGTWKRVASTGSIDEAGAPDAPYDWLDLAGPPSGSPDARKWLRHALQLAALSLDKDGVAWLTPPRGVRPWVSAEARQAGLRVKGVYAAFADARGIKAISPLHLLRDPALAGLAGRRIRLRELAAWAFRVPGVTQAFQNLSSSVAFAIGRTEGLPPFHWLLTAASVPAERGSVLLRRSWHEPFSGIAHLFQDHHGVTAVAKIPSAGNGLIRMAREERLLRGVAAGACGWGVETPCVLDFPRAQRPLLATRAIQGRPASTTLQRNPSEYMPVMERVTDWLTGWNRSTLASVSPGSARRELADAGSALESLIPRGREYFARLHEIAESESSALPCVASHGDLTMWNIMISRGNLGVLDWEEARDCDMPLGDLFYSMVDAAAALDGYRDRVAAFDRCFFGSFRPATTPLVERLARELGLRRADVEICFHLSWLRHACNEVRRDPAARGPFLEIARRISLLRSFPIVRLG